jgi:hypothetical protein
MMVNIKLKWVLRWRNLRNAHYYFMEKWIKGFEGIYRINTDGEIFSFYDCKRWKAGRLMANLVSRDGYAVIMLTKNKIRKKYKIHRLLALTFIENTEDKPFINHIDCNKLNNKLSNLEWCTAKENSSHAIKNNLITIVRGECISNSKLKNWQVLEIIKDNNTHKNIALKYGVTQKGISCIKLGITWSHLTGIVYKRKRLFPSDIKFMISDCKEGKSIEYLCNKYIRTRGHVLNTLRKNNVKICYK